MIFTYSELLENHVKLSFLRQFSFKSLNCKSCDEITNTRNIYEMEKHLSVKHRKESTSTKCPRCPASFISEEAFR